MAGCPSYVREIFSASVMAPTNAATRAATGWSVSHQGNVSSGGVHACPCGGGGGAPCAHAQVSPSAMRDARMSEEGWGLGADQKERVPKMRKAQPLSYTNFTCPESTGIGEGNSSQNRQEALAAEFSRSAPFFFFFFFFWLVPQWQPVTVAHLSIRYRLSNNYPELFCLKLRLAY